MSGYLNVLDNYSIYKKIGSGGSSKVYIARSNQYGFLFTLKIVTGDKNILKSGEYEAKILNYLSTYGDCKKNILCFYDAIISQDNIYIATEYINGWDLSMTTFISSELPTIFYNIAIALQRIHNAGVLHNDLKEQNIMIRPDNSIVIIDFGGSCVSSLSLAKKIGISDCKKSSHYYTVGYVAPEYLNEILTAKSDIYSIGIVFKKITLKTLGKIPDVYYQLIEGMTRSDYKKRWNLEDILSYLKSMI